MELSDIDDHRDHAQVEARRGFARVPGDAFSCPFFNNLRNSGDIEQCGTIRRKFLDLQQVLFLYALVHEFLEVVIEGDEAYTKVQKNVPPDQSRGWTILLMDRASRFIWALDCGKKDRRLFQKAIKTLDKIARQTHDLSIFTDGERRYGNLL